MQQLIIVMIVTGVAGGFAGYFISLDRGTAKPEPSEAASAKIVAPWFKYVFLGIIAAFIVPLFLSLAKSDLVTDIIKDSTAASSDLLIFAGFCLIAATSSQAFIQSLSDRILREARDTAKAADEKAEAAQEQVEQVAESLAEPEEEEEEAVARFGRAAMAAQPLPALDKEATQILRELKKGEWVLRSRSGLAGRTGLSKTVVTVKLEELLKAGLVRRIPIERKGGKIRTRWAITPGGRQAALAAPAENSGAPA